MEASSASTASGGDDAASSSFDDLYLSMLFLLCLWLAGDLICAKFLRIVPSLVGQIAVGVVFGPYVLDVLSPFYKTLGELGLVLMLCQSGLEMDLDVLKKIGTRGAVMAVVGSILPSAIGFAICYTVLDLDVEAAIAAGCSFGPTSAGIAMNVLQQCNILKTNVGQLIVAIAIVDDIIALVVLSQLKALTGETISAASIAIPIVSAFLWLFLGGATALFVMPTVFQWLECKERRVLAAKRDDSAESVAQLEALSLTHVMTLLFALLPATYYSEASFLLGAFLAGLCACQEKHAADSYNRQLSKIITWLMRLFFGATIAFEVPVTLFNRPSVIGTGFLLSLALLGKIATGPLLTPVLALEGRRCDQRHCRDCALVGLSMAGEAEMAFLVARFGLAQGLFDEEVYASIVFAILLSTFFSPTLLRLTIAFFPEGKDESPSREDQNSSRHPTEGNTSDENIGEGFA